MSRPELRVAFLTCRELATASTPDLEVRREHRLELAALGRFATALRNAIA